MSKKYFGVMLDMSRNAVMKPDAVKKFVEYISSFGYNIPFFPKNDKRYC